MIKCIVIGNFRGTCASVKMLKGYIGTGQRICINQRRSSN